MEIAHDSYRRKIRADVAERGGRYSCPLCGVRVVLARGQIQADHFRHVGRTPAERKRAKECELFVRSQGGGIHGAGSGNNQPPAEPSVRLYASWFDRDGRLGWALHLVVPRPTGNLRFFSFRVDEDAQSNGQRDIPAEQLSLRRFMIRARSGHYHVRGFTSDGQIAWRPPSTAQLHADCPNVFEVSSTGGFLVDSDEALVPGRSYLVLCHKEHQIAIPPGLAFPDLGKSPICDPRGIWRGHLLFLPAFASEELEDWCLDVLGHCLAEPPTSLEFVCPPAVEQEDGGLLINDASDIILFLGSGWPEAGTVFELTQPSGFSPDYALPMPSRFHRLSVSDRGKYELYVRDNSQVFSQRFSVSAPSIPTVAGVSLDVAFAETKHAEVTDLLDAKAGDTWRAILTRSAVLNRVNVPDGWSLDFYWQRYQGEQDQKLTLDAVQFANALNACLSSGPLYARLDAGPFGMVEWDSSVSSKRPARIDLPHALDGRLRWVLQALRRIVPEPGERLAIRFRESDLDRLSCSSRPIVKAFLDVPQWPAALLPQVRSTARDLAKLVNAGC